VPAIDVHAHVAVSAADALLEGQPALARQREVDAATPGPASVRLNIEQIAEIGPRLVDLDLRLAAMDAARVDVQAVSVTPVGASKVTLGSDYSFDMGVEDPVDRLDAADLVGATTDAIRGGNAARLLGLQQ
jgi:predicted TIM-barrel fold metal-dependent hydrolase